MKITVNTQEFNTILAALRYWQREGLMSSGHEHDIASNAGKHDELTAEEIDELCERINCESEPKPNNVAMDFVRDVAALVCDGEVDPKNPGAGEWDMPNDDAYDTLHSLISKARTIVEDKTTTPSLTIQISGGLVQRVILEGKDVAADIVDYDVDGAAEPELEYDEDGEPYILRHC